MTALSVCRTFICSFFVVIASTASSAVSQQPGQTSESDATQAEAKDLSTSQQITEALRKGDIAEATEVLQAAIASNPDDANLQRRRQLIASRLFSKREYKAAFEQMDQLFHFRAKRIDSDRDVAELASYAMTMAVYGRAAKEVDRAVENIDRAMEACETKLDPPTGPLLVAVTDLLSRKSSLLALVGASKQNAAAMQDHLRRLSLLNQSDDMSEHSLRAYARLLLSLARSEQGEESAARYAELDDTLNQALESFPDSEQIQSDYAQLKLSAIAAGYRDDPERAQRGIDELREKLGDMEQGNRTVRMVLSRLGSYENRIESALKLIRMVGKPAPPIDVDAWVNGKDEGAESLKGKVVLYDFWAIWCGPCIRTFPHLKEWREEFGDQGFEVVGITRYYGYQWDEEAGKATKADEKPDRKDEQIAVERFMQSHGLHHPCVMTPEGSTMQKEFAVSGIPHAVLVDRDGNMQMIKVGSSPQNAADLHAKIAELVSR